MMPEKSPLHERYEPTLEERRQADEIRPFAKALKKAAEADPRKVWGLLTGWDKATNSKIENMDEFLRSSTQRRKD